MKNPKINEDFVKENAFNASSFSNAKSLYTKNKVVVRNVAEDGSVIFGECAGSGKTNYVCSIEIGDLDNLLYNCTCPSRQFPCKHATALLFTYAIDYPSFKVAPLPEKVVDLRAKRAKRSEKKEVDKPKKAEKTEKDIKNKVLRDSKRIKTQLEGLELARKIIHNAINDGFSTINFSEMHTQIKDLGNYHINGVQEYFDDFFYCLQRDVIRSKDELPESIVKFSYLTSLIDNSIEYLNKRLENPDERDLNTGIESSYGHVFDYNELESLNLYEDNVDMIQLFFININVNSYMSNGSNNIAIWMKLNDHSLVKTVDYVRSKKAMSDSSLDNIGGVLHTEKLYLYPGDNLRRVRFNEHTVSDIKEEHYTEIINNSSTDFTEVIKNVKASFKNPMSPHNEYHLIKPKKILVDDSDQIVRVVFVDENDNQILVDSTYSIDSLVNLELVHEEGCCYLVYFKKNDGNEVVCNLLSAIKHDRIIMINSYMYGGI